jgi:shikimate kinase
VRFEDRNIVLTGFMGTGKSTVGRRLSRDLGFDWIDTDRLIEERHGPISEIFDRSGEEVFRAIERNIASELSTRTRHVFSTGGRMLLDVANIRSLSATGRVFCLTADPEVLVERLLKSPTPRPLLEGPDPEGRVRSLLAERAPFYSRFASIEAGVRSPALVAHELLDIVTAPTATPAGRRGLAVLPDALTDLTRPVTVVSDPVVGELHAPGIGPVDDLVTGTSSVSEGSVILLGGTSVTQQLSHLDGRSVVVAPTTVASMAVKYPAGVRVVTDLATLQTLPDRRHRP